jgi:hypothetical protein
MNIHLEAAASAGLHLSVFRALRESADRDQGPGAPGITGLMHSTLDRLRFDGADPELLRLAERISLTLHALRLALGSGRAEVEALRDELDDLTCEWLLKSPLPISSLDPQLN